MEDDTAIPRWLAELRSEIPYYARQYGAQAVKEKENLGKHGNFRTEKLRAGQMGSTEGYAQAYREMMGWHAIEFCERLAEKVAKLPRVPRRPNEFSSIKEVFEYTIQCERVRGYVRAMTGMADEVQRRSQRRKVS